jgi:hypothetical protein
MPGKLTKTTPTGAEATVTKAARSSNALWRPAPVMRTNSLGYLGRTVIEIWRDGEMRVVTTDTALIGRALAALQANPSVLTAVRDAAAKDAITSNGEKTTGAFLGRVVVEIWGDRTVVAATNGDKSLLAPAIKKLTSVLTAP